MISQEEVWREIGQIAVAYPLLKCDECAIAIIRQLERWQLKGTILQLKTPYSDEYFITSNRYGLDVSITDNGKHYGVEVEGKLFDNLSSNGLPREDWIADFNCLSGRFEVDEVSLYFLLSSEN